MAVSALTGEGSRRVVFDAYQRLAPRDLAGTDVRVVLIDSQSLESIGPWPWPRYYMARLTEEIAARGATIIAFDILFSEPDRVSPGSFVALYPELSAASASEVAALEPMDRLFGKVVASAPVVLARAGSDDDPSSARDLPATVSFTGRLPDQLDSWPGAIAAIPEIGDAALGHGLVNGRPDSDGVVRAVPLVMRVGGRPMPGFAFEVARASLDADTVRASASSLDLGGRTLPVDRHGRMLLHFGEMPPQHVVSADAVIRKAVPDATFAGKIVLIGLSAEGTSDIVATPLESESYGALVQAQAVDAILRGGALDRPRWAGLAEYAAGLALALLALLAAWGGRARRLAVASAFVALPIVSWVAFEATAMLIDAVRPLLVGGGAVAGVVLGSFAVARQERRRLGEVLMQERLVAAAAEGELQAARAIQMSMVPPRSTLATIDSRIDVDALLEPARTVGGDFFDLTRLSPDLIAFAIGDVTGKGVPAALFMAMSKALTRSAMSRDAPDLDRAAAAINRELIRDNHEAMSVTMLIGLIDLTDGSVRIISAGHEDPILYSSGRVATRHRLEGGPPFCLVEFDYPVETLRLRAGDSLVLVTDGITEAQNERGELYGRDHILDGLSLGDGSATEICEAIRDDVRRFEQGAEATDDLTVMVIRYL